jgi:hypothetical protein
MKKKNKKGSLYLYYKSRLEEKTYEIGSISPRERETHDLHK